jgi:c-di-GMP-binding flagellar brake protein YcgR
VAFAVLNGKKTTTKEAFEMGANFVLQKPISVLNASRCFHAALNFMIKERRRYFRHPVKLRVRLVLEGKIVQATSTNLSEGGMSIMVREALPKGAAPRLQFTLPDTNIQLDVEGEIAWADVKGHAGFRFHNVEKSTLAQLERWLDERMEQEFPGAKERMAAAQAAAGHGAASP